MCRMMNIGPMFHHCLPQSLHLLRFFFLAFTSTTSNNSQGSKSRAIAIAGPASLFSEYREPREYPLERNNRRQSRIPGIPVQSLNFLESAPIPAGIPDP